MRRSFFTIILLGSLVSAIQVSADTGDTTATFLEFGAGGRATAMGDAFTGIAEGTNAFYWNPAGAAYLGYTEMTAMHAEWFEDIRYEYMAFAKPFSFGTVGVDAIFVNYGLMEYKPEDQPVGGDYGNFSATDASFSIGFGRKLAKNISLGITGKFIYSKIHEDSTMGGAANLGAYWKPPVKGLTVGLAARNLGPEMTYIERSFPLPMTVAFGVAYRLWDELIVIATEAEKPLKDDVIAKGGLEINPHRMLSGRIGYNNGPDTTGLSGLTTGAGFNIGSFSFDFTYAPYEELGTTYQFGLTYTFGKEKGRITEEVERRMAEEFDKQKKDMINTLSAKAEKAHSAGNYQEAIDTYDVILVWEPENMEASSKMAQAQVALDEELITEHLANAENFMTEKKYTEAVLEYSLAKDIDPTNGDAVNGLAIAEQKLAELEALQAKEIAKLMSSGRDAYKRGDFETAVAKWNAVLKIDPNNEEAQNNLTDAEARITEMVSGYVSKAKNFETAGNWTEAKRYYAKAVRLDPDNGTAISGNSRMTKKVSAEVESYVNSGINLYKNGKYDTAESKFYQALNLDPGNSTANSYIGKIKDKRSAKPAESKTKDYSQIYLKGIEAYTRHQYSVAIAYWNQIPSSSAYYKKAQTNTNRAKSVLKKLGE